MVDLNRVNGYLRYLASLYYQQGVDSMYDEMMYEFEMLMLAANSYECCDEYGVSK